MEKVLKTPSERTFWKNVKEEIANIKKSATSEQIGKLLTKLDKLDSRFPSTCVYGLIIGNCWDEKAYELKSKCAVSNFYNYKQGGEQGFSYIGKEYKMSDSIYGLTSLEVALYTNLDKTKELILKVFN